jgi:hypothetical protein
LYPAGIFMLVWYLREMPIACPKSGPRGQALALLTSIRLAWKSLLGTNGRDYFAAACDEEEKFYNSDTWLEICPECCKTFLGL